MFYIWVRLIKLFLTKLKGVDLLNIQPSIHPLNILQTEMYKVSYLMLLT